jgi:hypothetical protein
MSEEIVYKKVEKMSVGITGRFTLDAKKLKIRRFVLGRTDLLTLIA